MFVPRFWPGKRDPFGARNWAPKIGLLLLRSSNSNSNNNSNSNSNSNNNNQAFVSRCLLETVA